MDKKVWPQKNIFSLTPAAAVSLLVRIMYTVTSSLNISYGFRSYSD